MSSPPLAGFNKKSQPCLLSPLMSTEGPVLRTLQELLHQSYEESLILPILQMCTKSGCAEWWLQDPNMLALPVNAPEADNSFPGTTRQGYGMVDPAGQKRSGRTGLGNLNLLRAAQDPWARPGWGMGRLDNHGSNSKPRCGAEGALESARHCPQPSSLQRPSKVRTVLPI